MAQTTYLNCNEIYRVKLNKYAEDPAIKSCLFSVKAKSNYCMVTDFSSYIWLLPTTRSCFRQKVKL